MKKLKIGIIILICLIVITVPVGLYIYFNGQKINGEKVAFKDKQEIITELEKVPDTKIIFDGDVTDVSDCVDVKVPDFEIKYGNQHIEPVITLDEDKVVDIVKSKYEGSLGEFEAIDYDKIKSAVKACEETDISDAKHLIYDQKVIDKYYKCREWACDYKGGMNSDENVSFNDAKSYVKIKDNKVVFDDSFIPDLIKKLEEGWDTLGKSMKVKLFSVGKRSKARTIPGGNTTWGTLMDSAGETKYIKSMFHKGKSIKDRTPILKEDHGGEIGDTRIEVSISKQKLWVYKKGKCIRTSLVVTGKDGHNTPKGVFYISERVPGKYLTGPGYKTWVNRWMRLTGQGVGLHDATWRSSFGGSIHYSSGSHGCINLPTSFAYWLYPKTYYGEPVIVY